jgi:lysozyme
MPGSGLSLGARITPESILARCGLWVANYHDSPEIPLAWAARGWRLRQYAGDENASHSAYGQTNIAQGLSERMNAFANSSCAIIASIKAVAGGFR